MAESILPNDFKPGSAIKAAHLEAVYRHVKAHVQPANSFITGQMHLTRPLGTSSADEVVATQLALLFKNMDAATIALTVGTPITDTVASITPSDLVAECVVPLQMVETTSPAPTDGYVQVVVGDDEDTVVYDAVNMVSNFPLRAGEGGADNEPPLVVEGYTRDYAVTTGEGEEEETETKTYFIITRVYNPCVIYEATLAVALLSTDVTAQVTPVQGIWGMLPTDTERTPENIHKWEADLGATCTVLRGYARDTLINVDCPTE